MDKDLRDLQMNENEEILTCGNDGDSETSKVETDTNTSTADKDAAGTAESVQVDYLSRFTPAVTDADIDAVKKLSRKQIDELKFKIKSADPAKIFLPANKSGYVCPFCGNGSGRDGDGIKPRTAVDGYVYHCFKSGDCEGDLLRIIATANNLSLKHDFYRILAIGKKIVESAYSGNFDDITVTPPSGIASDDDDTDTLFYIQDDIFRYSKTAAQIPESERRGLTLDTLNFVQAFWYENWIHPKYRDDPNYKIPPSRRIILPASKERYVAVIAPSDRDKIDVRFKNIHAGKENYLYHIFDKNVCKPPFKYLLVTEGEFDALSIFQATNHKYLVGATGGASKHKLILDFIKKRKELGYFADDFSVIILFDADKSGRTNAKKAVDALKSAGFAAFDCLVDDSLDANAYLQEYGDDALSKRIDEIIASAKDNLSAVQDDIKNGAYAEDNAKPATTKSKIPSCPVDLIIPGDYGMDEYCITKGKAREPITSTPIVPTRIFWTYGTGECLVELAYYTVHNKKWHGGIVVGKEILVDKNKVIQLAKFDVNINSSNAKNLAIYFSDILDFWRNREKLITLPTYRQTGWYKDSDGKYFFVNSANADNYLIKRAGWNFNDILTPKGDYDNQLAMFNAVADKGGVAARFTLGAALLAPMIKPLDLSPNVQLHLHGDRGQGKTPLAEFAVSIFANPSANGLQKTFQASNKNLYELPTAFNDLPVLVDELETMTQKRRDTELPLLIYDYSFGVGRQIQRKDGTQREVDRYNGTRITTGETQMLSVKDKSGNFKRIIQYLCKNLFDNDFSIGLHKFCGKNYGNIGKRWIELLTDAYNDTAKLQELKDFHDSILDRIRKRDNRTAIYEHTNIQTVAKCLFAYYLFKADLNVAAVDLKALDKDADEIISTLPTRNEMDDSTRAITSLKSVVNSCRAHFFKQNPSDDLACDKKFLPNEIYGFIYDTGAVAFYPHVLRRLLEKELGFQSTDKLLEEFKAKGFILCSKNRGYYRRVADLRTSIDKNRRVDVYYFAPNVLLTSDDDSTVDDSSGSYGNDEDSAVDDDSDNQKRFNAICPNVTACKADEFSRQTDAADKINAPSYVEPDDVSTPF